MSPADDLEPAAHQRLVDFLRLARDWTWETDADLKIIVASKWAVDVIGHDAEDILGKSLLDFGQFIDKHGDPTSVSLNGNFRNACFVAKGNQGEPRLMSISVIALFDPDTGAFTGARGIARPLN